MSKQESLFQLGAEVLEKPFCRFSVEGVDLIRRGPSGKQEVLLDEKLERSKQSLDSVGAIVLKNK